MGNRGFAGPGGASGGVAGAPDGSNRPGIGVRRTQGGRRTFFKRIAITGSFALTTLTSAVPAADGGALEGRLRSAADRGDAGEVRTLLERGAPIDSRDGQGRTALLLATHGNHVEAARVLIDAGADVNAKDAIQDSPYLYAGARGHLDILRMTLAHGADLSSTNRYRGTALIPAAARGHVETVHTLIDAGVNVDHVNRLGWTALLEAIMLGDGSERYLRIVQLLVDGHANVDLADSNGETPLRHARRRGYAAIERVPV